MAGYPPCGRETKKVIRKQKLCIASWNVCTLLDNDNNPQRRTAIIGHELGHYGTDIAAVSETCIHGESQLEEVGAGYTFFLTGHPADGPTQAGVGFAIRTSLLHRIQNMPVGHSPRLMSLTLELEGGHMANLVIAYAPTLPTPDDAKDELYNQFDQIISRTPCKHKLIMMGNFNVRVRCDHQAWEKVIGRHGIGKENSNSTRLLSLCTAHKLVITNTMFQQRDSRKVSWMHPRSRHWNLLDCVIVRQRDIADVNLTRSLRGSTC